MLFVFAPDEDNEALASCDDIASLKAWVVHSPLICSLGFLLIGGRTICGLRTCTRNEFLRPATRVLYALLPLLTGERGISKVLQLLREAVR
jgi:hypothetical protein